MSYVRWSTKVREGCKRCDDTGSITISPEEQDEYDRAMMDDKRLCDDCTSCWYIYWHVDGYIMLHHCGCDGYPSAYGFQLPFDRALTWTPPTNCKMADVALDAVKRAHADWEKEGHPDDGRASGREKD